MTMALPDLMTVVSDPDFHGLPFEERRKVLKTIDSDFAGLPAGEQEKALAGISKRYSEGSLKAPTPQAPNELKASHTPAGSQPNQPAVNPAFEAIAPYYRAALEGGGMVAGGTMGAAAGLPTGPGAALAGVAGGAMGYAAGKRGADYIDESLGLRKPLQLEEVLPQTASDLKTGAMMEMGGQVANKLVFQPVMKYGKLAFDKASELAGAIFTKGGTEKAAGNVIKAATSSGDIYAANAEQAASIEKEIPGLRFSMGQRTNDPNIIKLERAQMRKPGEGANVSSEQIASNNEALRAYYQKNFGAKENIDDLIGSLQRTQETLGTRAQAAQAATDSAAGLLPSSTPQETGQAITGKIQQAKAPVKATMNELEAQIPDYPMEFSATKDAIRTELQNPKASMQQKAALASFAKDMDEIIKKGPGTHSAMGVRRTLTDQISDMTLAGKDSAARALLQVKEALESDLAAISEKAVSGEIKLYRGQVGDPSKLTNALEGHLKQIAELKAKQAPDIKAMQDVLQQNKIPAMRVTHESDASFAERLGKDYTNITGKPIPTKGAEAEAKIAELTSQANEIKAIISELEPGSDVAVAMRTFNKYAREQYFERFKKGAVATATQKGNQITGGRMPMENIGKQFTTPSGADDLIRAIGPEEAAQAMKGHFSYDMMKNTTDPATGKIVTAKLNAWIGKNSAALERFGIKGDFAGVQNAQEVADKALAAAAGFEKTAAATILKADPGKAIAAAFSGNNPAAKAAQLMQMVSKDPAAKAGLQRAYSDHMMEQIQTTAKDIVGNPEVSNAAFQRLMAKNSETLKVIYKEEPEKIKALNMMKTAYEISIRNKKSPIGGGSDTAENVLTELGKLSNIPLPRTVSIARGVVKVLTNIGKNNVDDLVTQSLFNPDYAETLIKASRGQIKPEDLTAILNGKIVSADAYRTRAMGQAAAGMGAAALGVYGNTR
jgi:hypothetical protein